MSAHLAADDEELIIIDRGKDVLAPIGGNDDRRRERRGDSPIADVLLHLAGGHLLAGDEQIFNRLTADHRLLYEIITERKHILSTDLWHAYLERCQRIAYYDDKTLPSLPASVLNVMQAGRASNRSLFTSPETAAQQMALPFDYVVTGSYSLRIHVK